MSFSGFDDAVQAYTNEISSYKDQYNDYKNQLMDYRDQAKELSVEGFTEVGVPLIVEALKTPLAQAGIAKAQQAVTQFFTPKVQTKVGAPEAEPDAVTPAAPEPVIAQQPLAPRSPWERPPADQPADETIPTQDDILDAAAQRAPQEVSADMLPEGAGQLVNEADQMVGRVADVAAEAGQQVTTMATQAVSQVAQAGEQLVGMAGEAAGRVVGQAAQAGEQLVSQVTGMASEAAGQIVGQATQIGEGLATQAGEALTQAVSGLGTQAQGLFGMASNALSQLTAPVAEAGDAVASGISAVAGAATEAGAAIGGEVAGEVAASAAGGPVGLVIGGLIAVGTLIAEAFTHHHAAAPIYNPDADSVPVYQSGLATGS